MMRNKRGQGLSMNTVIIGIIVLVVLIVIIAFFTGGTSTIVQKVQQIFGGTAAQDFEIAVENCKAHCDIALDYEQKNLDLDKTAYCSQTFKLDIEPKDGAVDKDPDGTIHQWTCSEILGEAGYGACNEIFC